MNKPWLSHYDPGVPVQLEYPAIPLFDLLTRSAHVYPHRACTVLDGEEISFHEMDELTSRMAEGFVRGGIQKGDRVGMLLPNIPEFVAAYFAILKAGGIVVAMNPSYKPREIETLVQDAGVTTLLVLQSSYAEIFPLRNRTGLRRMVVVAEDIQTNLLEASAGAYSAEFLPELAGTDSYLSELLQESSSEICLPEVVPDSPAIYQYTGGTTGEPKAAIGLHRNLVANTMQFRHWLVNLKEGKETMLMAIPMFHVYGMVVGMSLAITLGAPMVLEPNPRDLRDLLGKIRRYQPTIFPGVPSMYNRIIRDSDVQAGRYALSSIKACISGSAPLMRETKEQFEAITGGKLVEGYGLSEAPTATHCNPILGENRTGSIGLPLSDVDACIVSLEDQRSLLLPGEIGELVLRSPQVMAGYYHREEETKLALQDGWLHTGDIARMDADGYFYLVDRKKEMIKVSGLQVWPREVEEVLAGNPKVFEAGVSGIPDPIRGEAVKAWVVLQPGQQAEAEEMIAWCAENLAYYKVPVEIEFRTELPKTTVGKILRRQLLKEHLESKREH